MTPPLRNVGLRLPLGVVGLDIDDYGAKTGGQTLEDHLATFGPLPPTWTVTSRTDRVSGVRLYRTTFEGPFRGKLEGGHIDVIHHGLRYLVLPPSLHPDHRTYVLLDPFGCPTLDVPRPEDLPWMPERWHRAVSSATCRRRPTRRSTEPSLPAHAVASRVREPPWLPDEGSQRPCARVSATLTATVGVLADARRSDVVRHDLVRGAQAGLLRLRKTGHRGVKSAMEELRETYVEEVDRPGTGAEFDRALDGAWELFEGDPHPRQYAVCSCTLDLLERAIALGLGLSKGTGRENEQAVLTYLLSCARRTGSRLTRGQSQRTIGEQANISQPRVAAVIKRLRALGYIGALDDQDRKGSTGNHVLQWPRGVLNAIEAHGPLEGVSSLDTGRRAALHPLFAAQGLGKGVGETFAYLPYLALSPNWDGVPTTDTVALRVGRLPGEPMTLVSGVRRPQGPLRNTAPTLQELVTCRGRRTKTLLTHLETLVAHGLALEVDGRWYRTLFNADWLLEYLGLPDVTAAIKARNVQQRKGFLAAQQAYRDLAPAGVVPWIDTAAGEYFNVTLGKVVRASAER